MLCLAWLIEYTIDDVAFKTSKEIVCTLIENYCGIANNKNIEGGKSDTDIALAIGRICIDYPDVVVDFKNILTKDNCKKGMLKYLDVYRGGLLPSIAKTIGDGGQFINHLAYKFNSDAANWVWNRDTVHAKIDELITEYEIVEVSNKVLTKNVTYQETIRAWCGKIEQIRLAFSVIKNELGDARAFYEMLYNLKKANSLLDSQKQQFLALVKDNIDNFKYFMSSQSSLFMSACGFYLDDLTEEDAKIILEEDKYGFKGTFTAELNVYTGKVQAAVKTYKSTLGHIKLRKSWMDLTSTESPFDWSNKYGMPIMIMVPAAEAATARSVFATINTKSTDDNAIKVAEEYITKMSYLPELNSRSSRDKAFAEAFLGEYAVLFEDVEKVTADEFAQLYAERKEILKNFVDSLDEAVDYCKVLSVKEEKAIYYLTDLTQPEKERVFEWLNVYGHGYTSGDLTGILRHIYPDLSDYLSSFRFRNGLLDSYFESYKYQKVINRILPNFELIVDEQSRTLSFVDVLPARSAIVDKLDLAQAHAYFLDALGVEYLGYIQAKCNQYGLSANIMCGRCELPSLTCFNKDFVVTCESKGCAVSDIKSLDEIKHHGENSFDYQKVKIPVYLISELEVIDTLLKNIRAAIYSGYLSKAVIISDHGASRLAVLHETETLWRMATDGVHSGRCCPQNEIDVKPDSAIEAEGFWVLANYDRFKGGRKANVEVHGGATLQKLSMLTRLLPFVEKRVNIIELAPKGTGKSYVFGHISKHGMITDGGKVTRAKMFYDATRRKPGFICGPDFVAIDEVKLVNFGDENEMRSILQGYLEYGKFNANGYDGESDAGVVFLGNIQQENMDEYTYMLGELPALFQETALLDRIHGFVKGWDIPRMNDSLKITGWALNSEYFCSIMHELRSDLSYRAIVERIVDVPERADTRDTEAIKRIATAYLKLLFPHVRSEFDVDKQEFNDYCLIPAMRMRRIIKLQQGMIDREYKGKDVPLLTVKV